MGRDASSGQTGFDGKGVVTSVGRSMDPGIYHEMEKAIKRIADYYDPKKLFIKFTDI